jgi:type I restriction enzyme, R subunit
MDKHLISERDICTKFSTPALVQAGWVLQTQIAEEKTLTDGRIIVRGPMVARGRQKRAHYVLYLKPNIPVAVVEAKDNSRSVADAIQQAADARCRRPVHRRSCTPVQGQPEHGPSGMRQEMT